MFDRSVSTLTAPRFAYLTWQAPESQQVVLGFATAMAAISVAAAVHPGWRSAKKIRQAVKD